MDREAIVALADRHSLDPELLQAELENILSWHETYVSASKKPTAKDLLRILEPLRAATIRIDEFSRSTDWDIAYAKSLIFEKATEQSATFDKPAFNPDDLHALSALFESASASRIIIEKLYLFLADPLGNSKEHTAKSSEKNKKYPVKPTVRLLG